MSLITIPGTFGTHSSHLVEIKTNWEDDWTPVADINAPHFRCSRMGFRVAPEIPTAAFTHRYGRGKPQEHSTYGVFSRKQVAGHYVRVSGPAIATWHEIFTD